MVLATFFGSGADVAKAASEIVVVTTDVRTIEAYYSFLGVDPCPDDTTYCEYVVHPSLGGSFDDLTNRPDGVNPLDDPTYGAWVKHDTEIGTTSISGTIGGYTKIHAEDLDFLLATPLLRTHGESMFHTEFEVTEDVTFELTVTFLFEGAPGLNTASSFLNNRIEFLFEGVDAMGQPFQVPLSEGLEDDLPAEGVTYSFAGDVRANETLTLDIGLYVDRNWLGFILPEASWVGYSDARIDFELSFSQSLFNDGFETGDLCSWAVGPCAVAVTETP